MTHDNHHPLANPLNKHQYQLHGFKKDLNATLPQGQSYDEIIQYQNNLHVPNTTYPSRSNLDLRSYGKTWNDNEINIIGNIDQINNEMTPNEIKHENYLKQQNAKLSAEMSDTQKELLANIEQYIGKSNLIEEN